MSAQRVTVCHWIQRRRVDTSLHEPTWGAVEQAIRSMDGREVNDIYLYPEEDQAESFLCVGGGPERYVVVIKHPTEGWWTIVDPAKPSEPVVALTVGGQDGEFPTSWLVDVDCALQAAQWYFHHGTRAPELSWEQQ